MKKKETNTEEIINEIKILFQFKNLKNIYVTIYIYLCITWIWILVLQGPLKITPVVMNDFSAGIINVAIPPALHALLNALANAYNSIYTYN
jgi:hypothetical protein